MNVKNWENVIDEIGEFCIVVRSVSLDNMLRDGLVVDICIEDYEGLAEFTRRYEVCMIALRDNFVRLVVHIKY